MTVKSDVKTEETFFQILREDGSILDRKLEPELSSEELKQLYYLLVLTRTVDERFIRMQRQGRVGFYLSSAGEEAAHIGSAYALNQEDWIFPQYREPGAVLLRGMPLMRFAAQIMGNSGDLTKGRQMPCHYSYKPGRYLSVSSPVGTQIPQAVGFAWAGKIRGERFVTLVYFGDGSTSQGDFHVGMNFAGVFKAPVIFFCKNNQWAISVPASKQTASANIAVKGIAYGVESVRVDGNDLLAVIHVTRQAVKKARQGHGPTLIEAVTYRIGAHSTSDDPRLYGNEKEAEKWKKRDPILRFQRYLKSRGIWDTAFEEEVQHRAVDELSKAIDEVEKFPLPPVESLFEDVYAELLPNQKDQMEEFVQFMRKSKISEEK